MNQSENLSGNNLKHRNEEFCIMWRCARYEKTFPCTHCLVIDDVNAMARALHVNSNNFDNSIAPIV
ncbi:MAG: hypothetical protein GX640_13220 [Fibrobacter sp.]|nr:hypothetical protein [Fibrobacter sp.]